MSAALTVEQLAACDQISKAVERAGTRIGAAAVFDRWAAEMKAKRPTIYRIVMAVACNGTSAKSLAEKLGQPEESVLQAVKLGLNQWLDHVSRYANSEEA